MTSPIIGLRARARGRAWGVARAALAALAGATGLAAATGCDARAREVDPPRATAPAAARIAAEPGGASPARTAPPAPIAEQTFRFGAFGTVRVLRAGAGPATGTTPPRVLLFASGGAWDANAERIARALVRGGAPGGDALVFGVDGQAYGARLLRGRGCAYPAADFEALSQYGQHQLGLARYAPPVLVGDAAGAALAYAALAQAPRGTFPGAVALDFPADFRSPKPFCGASRQPPLGVRRGNGVALTPDSTLHLPVAFLTVPAADGAPWPPALGRALDRIAPIPAATAAPGASGAPSIADLPLVRVAPNASPDGSPGAAPPGLVAVVVSGDGGWASIDREVGETLAAGGVPVVGLNALQYFWTTRTPDGAGADLARLVASALAAPPGGGPPRSRVLLVGYSRGADVLPFMARRLPAALRAKVAGVALLGLEPSVAFEFHVSDWLGGKASGELPTLPEIAGLRAALPAAVPVLCLYGAQETDSACPAAARQAGAQAVAMPGGHHLGGDYPALARRILASVH